MRPSEVLAAARALIDAPEKWARGSMVRVQNDACAWCITGALLEIVERGESPGEQRGSLWDAGRIYLIRAIGLETIAAWNDAPERTWGDVMVALKEAERLALLDGQ